jgi:competence protein ComEC
VSFQLSFAAVFAIVYGLDHFRPQYAAAPPGAGAAGAGRRERLRRGLAVFVLVSVFATWGTLPLVMHYFNTVSLISLPANGLAVPLIGYAAVLLGLFGAFLEALSPEAATLCFQASGWVLTLSIAALKWMAGLPFAAVRTVTPSAFEVIWIYAASWAGIRLYLARRRRAAPAAAPGRSAPAPSSVRAAAGWLALCLLVGALDAGYWLYQRYGRRDLRVSVLDVGQGNAVLLQLPGGHTVLVDGGGLPDAAGFDIGAAVVAPYLWREKIAAVDTMVLSHPNSDHVNGLAFIAENFKVGSLWTNGEGGESWGYRRLIETCHRRGIAVPDYASLPLEFPVGGVRLERLYPPADFSERRESDRWRRDGNNNSLVLRVVFGDFALLLPGDIMRPAERELVGSAGPGLKSQALLAPHHGSRTSSGEAFLAAAAPEAVLISCAGRGGSWPPHAEVLSRYADRGARVYRTDRHGAIRLTSDGRGFRVETELRD